MRSSAERHVAAKASKPSGIRHIHAGSRCAFPIRCIILAVWEEALLPPAVPMEASLPSTRLMLRGNMEGSPFHERPVELFHALDRNAGAASATRFEARSRRGVTHSRAFKGGMVPQHRRDITRIECIARARGIDDVRNMRNGHSEALAIIFHECWRAATPKYDLSESSPGVILDRFPRRSLAKKNFIVLIGNEEHIEERGQLFERPDQIAHIFPQPAANIKIEGEDGLAPYRVKQFEKFIAVFHYCKGNRGKE